MIKFYVLTDDLLYKKQIENIIDKVVETGNYTISNNVDNINSENNNIYIIDLEYIQKIDYLYNVRKHDKQGHIIIITSKKTELDIYSYQLEGCTLIDKENNYLEKLENSILNSLGSNHSFNIKIENDNNHLRIPLDEISEIKTENDKTIIEVLKKSGKKYTYIFISKPNDVVNLKEFIFNVKSNNLKLYYGSSYIVICDEKKKHKIYSEDLKNNIISLYLKGVSINYLSKKYDISTSTIYNWIKKYELENKLKELENNNTKYRKIEEIVNSK